MRKMAHLHTSGTFGHRNVQIMRPVSAASSEQTAQGGSIAKEKRIMRLTVMSLSCSLGCPPVSRNHFCSACTKTYGHVNFTTAPMSSYFSHPVTHHEHAVRHGVAGHIMHGDLRDSVVGLSGHVCTIICLLAFAKARKRCVVTIKRRSGASAHYEDTDKRRDLIAGLRNLGGLPHFSAVLARTRRPRVHAHTAPHGFKDSQRMGHGKSGVQHARVLCVLAYHGYFVATARRVRPVGPHPAATLTQRDRARQSGACERGREACNGARGAVTGGGSRLCLRGPTFASSTGILPQKPCGTTLAPGVPRVPSRWWRVRVCARTHTHRTQSSPLRAAGPSGRPPPAGC